MDIDVLNSQLYDKMVASQEKMKDWLQSQSFDDMMKNAYEYLIRNDLLLTFQFHDLSDEQVFALWELEDPLAELYKSYTLWECDNPITDISTAIARANEHHEETLKETIEHYADSLIAEKQRKIREMPVYLQTADYAKEHGEAELHSESHKANVMCANAIEDTIAMYYDFDKKRLDPIGAEEILKAFGPERTTFVLAANIQDKSWDGRITDSNKEWAKQFVVPQDDSAWGTKRYRQYLVTSHPGLLDLFTKQVQKALEQSQEKSQSILSALRETPAVPHEKSSVKKKAVER